MDLFEHLLKLLRRQPELVHDLAIEGIERLADTQKKIIEEFVEGFYIAGAFHQRRAQGVAKHLRIGDADQIKRAKRVHVFRQRHTDAITAQYVGELDNARFHWRCFALR